MTAAQILGGVLVAAFIVAIGAFTKSGASWGEWATTWAVSISSTAVVVVGLMLLAGEIG